MRVAALNAGLFVLWLLITTTLYRSVPGTAGVLLASLWPLLAVAPGAAWIWWRGRVLRRRLLDQEFRD